MANGLSKVLEKLILMPQNPFFKCKQILNSIFIASEGLNSCLKSRESGLMWKLDMEKTYNLINWSFFYYTCLRDVALLRSDVHGSNTRSLQLVFLCWGRHKDSSKAHMNWDRVTIYLPYSVFVMEALSKMI